MKDFFQLEKHGTTFIAEFLAGVTTFLTMSYIVTINPSILNQAGMPYRGVFVATILASGLVTIIMALYANVPFGAAPGMGLNMFAVFTICLSLRYHWREAMAMIFISGILHVALILSPMRKTCVVALPHNIRNGIAAGLGVLIAYVGIKLAAVVEFTINPGSYKFTLTGSVLGDATTHPSFVSHFDPVHLVMLTGMAVTLYLLAQEKKTGDRYYALFLGILAATFVGIPLGLTNIGEVRFLDLGIVGEVREVAVSFFGRPGLLSLFDTPARAFTSVSVIFALAMTDITEGLACIISLGQMGDKPLIEDNEMKTFIETKGIATRLDRALIANSIGSFISSLAGTTQTTTYIESSTGIAAGGKTGLTGLVIGLLFLACVPFAGFFAIIPEAAISSALVVVGCYLVAFINKIQWRDLTEAVPAGITMMMIPLSMSIIDGMGLGILAHLLIQFSLGKAKQVNILLIILGGLYLGVTILKIHIGMENS